MINKFNFNSNRSLLLQYTALGFQWFRSFYIRSRINCCIRQQCNMDTAQKKPPHIYAWGNCSRCRDVYSQRRHNPQSPTAQGLSQFPGRMHCCLFTKSCRASSWVPRLKTFLLVWKFSYSLSFEFIPYKIQPCSLPKLDTAVKLTCAQEDSNWSSSDNRDCVTASAVRNAWAVINAVASG